MKAKQLLKRILGLQSKVDNSNEPGITFDLAGDYAEELYSKQILEYKDLSVSQLFDNIVKKIGCTFGGWALSQSSLRFLIASIDQQELMSDFCVVELGGGQSTLFWKELSEFFPGVKVVTWEHNQEFIDTLKSKIIGSGVRLESRKLQQYSNADWEKIFSSRGLDNISKALTVSCPTDLPLSEYCNTRVQNVFYSIDDIKISKNKIDVLVIDGPHGNGRSLAFPAFVKYFRTGTLILIDDVSHYSFLEMLSKFVKFQILHTSFSLKKQWILVRVTSYVE